LVAEQEARTRQYQQDLWSRADRVFTARIKPGAVPDERAGGYRPSRGGPPKPPMAMSPIPPLYGQVEAELLVEPVAGLKGTLPARAFSVVQEASWSSCGTVYQFNDGPLQFQQAAISAGETVIVFLSGPYPTQEGVLGTLRVDQVVDPDLRAALESRGVAP
jgi:hypothetical protein